METDTHHQDEPVAVHGEGHVGFLPLRVHEGPQPLETVRSRRVAWGIALALSAVLHGLVVLAFLPHKPPPLETKPTVASVEVELVPSPEVIEQPEPETLEEQQPEMPPSEEQADPVEAADEPPAEDVLQPVVKFGETDGGQESIADGSAAEAEVAPNEPTGDRVAEEQASDEALPEDLPVAETASDEPAPQEHVAETPPLEEATDETAPDQPTDVAAEETQPGENPTEQAGDPQAVDTDPSGSGESAETPEDFGVVGPIVADVSPAPKPAPSERRPTQAAVEPQRAARSGPPLARARELFSSSILSDVRTQTAMRGMGPAERLNLLCMTELRAQLVSLYPNQPPDMLPTFRPQAGTVLEPARAAYRSRGEWFDLAFRCETDPGVTQVRTFDFRVGPPIPPSQWAERGLPSF